MLIVLFLLNGCTHSTPSAVKIPIPADLVQPCKKVPEFDGKDMMDIVKYTKNLITLYKTCSARHSALTQVAK